MDNLKHDGFTNSSELIALHNIYDKIINECNNKGYNYDITNNLFDRKKNGKIIKQPIANKGLNRNVLQEVLFNTFDIVTEKLIMDRIFYIWNTSNLGVITLDSWLNGLEIILKSSFSTRLDYCFSIYDLNGDGYITKDEILQLLRHSILNRSQDEDIEENVKFLIDIIVKKMDIDRDGKVSFSDYRATVQKEPLLLEVFGKCLPTEETTAIFLTNLKNLK